MKATRRDILLFTAGAAAAVPLTPVPWKLLDDASIWTQNWSWIPRPIRGETRFRYTTCTLCFGACQLRVRCTGEQPIGITGVANHPAGRGTLCPLAAGAHQLPYHASRVRQALRHRTPVTAQQAVAEVAAAIRRGGRLAILDEAPGRSASVIYRDFATAKEGDYVALRPAFASTLDRVAESVGVPGTEAGLDLENTRTVLSFGLPLLESAFSSGRILPLWTSKKLRVEHYGSELSRTAALAAQFTRLQPGTEGITAVRLAAEHSGVELPALALSAGNLAEADEQAIADLNAALGASTFVRRRPAPFDEPAGVRWDAIPDHSLSVLIIDHGPLGGSLPWSRIERKLATGALVVSITPYLAGSALQASLVIPAPAWLEAIADAGTPWDAPAASYSVGPALLPKPEGILSGTEFVAALSGGEDHAEAVLRERCAAIHKAGRGHVFVPADGATKPVSEFESADKVYETLSAGAGWIDDSAPEPLRLKAAAPKQFAAQWEEPLAAPLAIAPPLPRPAVRPPLACKLDRESAVEHRSGYLYLHPEDARATALRAGDMARVETQAGTFTAIAAIDPNIAPGTAAVNGHEAVADAGWTRARLVRI